LDAVVTAIGNITIPAPTGGATSDNQTNGTQKTQIVDAGGEAVTVTAGKLDVNAAIDTTGLATSTKQDTIIGHVDGIETLLTTIEANQLPDGHNVTVGNTSIAVTGTFCANNPACFNSHSTICLSLCCHSGCFCLWRYDHCRNNQLTQALLHCPVSKRRE
jgi:hypothetical protein